MSRYIDADKVKQYILSTGFYCDTETDRKYSAELIDELFPTADVVERVYRGRRPSDDLVKVVRCKDCKHADLFYPYCTIWEAAIDGDGYCYKGEKE